MYSHLLVPLDGSELSVITAGKAIQFAQVLKARITFLHATSDYSATQDGALQMLFSLGSFAEAAVGQTNVILAKAGAAAAAAGVPYKLLSVVSDQPHQAIINTAKNELCDLVFMASHARKGLLGLLKESNAVKVLRGASVGVLVATIELNDPDTLANRAVAVIQDEHRSLAVVIRGLIRYCEDVAHGGATVDIQIFRDMIHYMRSFPGALHHPKEERYLFARLQARTDKFDQLIAELHRQHTQETVLVGALEHALTDYEDGSTSTVLELKLAMSQLAEAIWMHMGMEEREIIPGAREHLTDADWQEIAAAFEASNDPLSEEDTSKNFAALFTKIANYLPDL